MNFGYVSVMQIEIKGTKIEILLPALSVASQALKMPY